jgi:two-component system nitrate/nitrite response regulator NarL
MARSTEKWFEPLGLVWIDCSSPVVSGGLAQILKTEALVYVGQEPPNGALPSVVILCADGIENIAESVKRVRAHLSNAVIVIFGMYPDLALAQTALKSGARGFIHSGMRPEQIVRALKVAFEGEMVAPRELLEYLIMSEQPADLNLLSARQREILELLSDGLTNAQIAKRLFLTESTIKQHLRGAYKILGVSNRTEAAKLLRNSD